MGRQYPVGITSNEQFMVGTNLPPKIDGQLRRHVLVEIPFIKWLSKRSNPNVFTSLVWRDEEGKGTIFRPANEEDKKISKRFVRAVYGITSGPKRFSDYLNDMKVMSINVFNESDSSLIGQAQVKNLSTLTPLHSISGLYPVVNASKKKIAEIKVHLSIVSLASLQEDDSEVPTPDGGLNPVENSENFLDDLKSAHLVKYGFKKAQSVDNISNSLQVVGNRIYNAGSSGKELEDGIMDSIVDSLEKLRSEMTKSCLKVDVSGPIETHGDILASTLPRSSRLLSLQPSDVILNSILNDDGRGFDHRFNPEIMSSDDLKLLEQNELIDLFYDNLPNPIEDGDVNNIEKISKEPKIPLKISALEKNVQMKIPPKLRRDLSQASGILMLVNSFTLVTSKKQFVKDARNDRELSSDCMLSISIFKADDANAHPLVKMKPLLVKSKGRVLQFNQKTTIEKTSFGIEDQDLLHSIVQFKLLERSSAQKFKVIGQGEYEMLDLLVLKKQGEALKLNLDDITGNCLGLLEVNLKMLSEQRDIYYDGNLNNETKNANKTGRTSELVEMKHLKEEVPLYACLVIPQGHIFTTDSKDAECVTLKVRSHWNDCTTAKATISKEGRVLFNLIQVHALSQAATLVNKMKLNFVIIEVWTSSNNINNTNKSKERLLGLSKLPVDAFFRSFGSKEGFESSLASTFPVVAVDANVPIASPTSRTNGGLLQVLLAMGTYEQVLRVLDFKMKIFPEFFCDSVLRSEQLLERRSHSAHAETVEHMLEVCIESITNLRSLELQGNEECYVRFLFPDLQHDKFYPTPRQTSSVACEDRNVEFNECFKQFIVLPEKVSLCWHICKAYSINKWPSEITFQLWFGNRFSSGSDRLVAKGVLTLNEFFRSIDGKLPGDVASSRECSIDLLKSSSATSSHENDATCGVLNVRVIYSSSQKEKEMLPSHANPLVEHARLSVQILRACGLKYAVQLVQDFELQRNRDSLWALNTFLATSLVIDGQSNTKITQVVGNSFRPEFNTQFEFLCPLTFDDRTLSSSSPDEKSSRLVRLFEKAYLEIVVYSTNVEEGDNIKVLSGKNILIGKVKMYLADLLKRQTGLRGWLPIEIPQQNISRRFQSHGKGINKLQSVGGIEVAVELSSSTSPLLLDSLFQEERMWPFSVPSSVPVTKTYNIQLKIDNLSFPPESLLDSDTQRNASAMCYVTYKFFDRDAVHSEFYPLSMWAGVFNVDINHVEDFVIISSPTFVWYLTEEKLEIQVWIRHGIKSKEKLLPRPEDELVGSGFIRLAELVEFKGRKAISSGYCPLFNAHSDYLGSACLHYNVQASISEMEQEADKNTCEDDKTLFFREEDNFLACVAIERAYHLPRQQENKREVLPNSYVTFETSKSFESTNVVERNCDPLWNYEANVWLGKEFLSGHENNLKFKVWHKSKIGKVEFGGALNDKCLGFASVDLKPLLTEKFQTVAGFYNVIDCNGSQQGQIKVSVTPLQKLFVPNQYSQLEMINNKHSCDEIVVQSAGLIAKDITDALDELTSRLKHKMSQSLDILSHPAQDVESVAQYNQLVNQTSSEEPIQRHPNGQDFEEIPSPQSSSPNIFIQNYNLEPCECHDDFQDMECLSEKDCLRDCTCNSVNKSPEGNEAVDLISHKDFGSQKGFEEFECSSVPHFSEKCVQTETRDLDGEALPTDFQNSLKVKPESSRSTPSSLASDPAERRNILVGDWMSEHKRKVSQRIVAFKSFKVPSIEESQRIAKILANKLQQG